MTQRELQIRPLSEGIGLGALKPALAKTSPSERSIDFDAARSKDGINKQPSRSVSAEIDTTQLRQAHAAYAPHSTATEMRQRSSTRWWVAATRFMVGWGTDILFLSFSAFVLAWVSVLAWNAGSSGEFDVMNSLMMVVEFIQRVRIPQMIAATLTLALLWRMSRILIAR